MPGHRRSPPACTNSSSRAFGGRAGLAGCSRLVRSRARGWELAAVARPVQSGRVAGVGSTHDVGREREPRLARAARGARHLVAHRLGRSRHRHLANRRHADRSEPGIPSSRATNARSPSARPRLAADVPRPIEQVPIGTPPRSGSSSRRSGDRTANGCGSTRRARPGRSPIFTRSTTWRRRHRRPTASASTPGSATARSSRST